MPIELAISPDARWPGTGAELAAAAGAAGFDAVGVRPEQLDGGTVDAFAAAGIRCHEMLALVVSDDERQTVASAEELAEAAAKVGAEWVLAVCIAPLGATTGAIVERCATVIAAAGAGMAIEFTPLGPVPTIAAGMEVVRAAERAGGRSGLLVDTWHFFHGDSTWEDLATLPLDAIAYLQFDDALAPQPGASAVAETLHRRALPGEGVLDLHRFVATLRERGWEGIVSAEVLSAELRTHELSEIVGRIHDTMAPYWR